MCRRHSLLDKRCDTRIHLACIQNNVFFGVVEELKMVIVYCLWLEESLLEAVTLDQLCDTKIHN